MIDTYGKPLSREWLLNWFPEYFHGASPIVLVRWPWGTRRTRETTPWAYTNTKVGSVDVRGYIRGGITSVWPWKRYARKQATQEQYEAFLVSINWFRNGGKTMDGGPGLDPRELIGGWIRPGSKIYHCKNGTYTPARKVYGMKGVLARFYFHEGTMWEGDHWL